ncbi:ABC-F family ATP-binding cassette domain-containing protein [Streptomyces sp. NPDC058290]|uniref:ABC-F family ATP-binding cassette domain-containing protein n=1 Tax=Streptomyces sp. NPDC058290 TaxID=3346426 RepID=UPI0036E58815
MTATTAQLTALDVTKAYEGRPVLDSVSCSLPPGGRIGIVGENGSGKSTLLRLFAGVERPDRGRITVRADGGIGYLAQEEELPGQLTVQQVIDRSLAPLRSIEAELRRMEQRMTDGAAETDPALLTAYADLLTGYELRGGYEADARVERALHGLGLVHVPRDRSVGGLSGGERVRLRLAALLAAAPEVLLLDEPTNHLDDVALSWLEEHLRSRAGTTVTVSHDRVFLDRVATVLLEVDGDTHRVVRYGNGYAGYLAEHAADRQRRTEAHAAWQAEVEALRARAAGSARRVAPGRARKDGNKMAYDRAAGRVQQSVAGRVRQAGERLERLLAHPLAAPPEPLRFTAAPRSGRTRGLLVSASALEVQGRLAPVDLALSAGDRLLVSGPNGAGKSTLLGLLAGDATHAAPQARGHLVRRGRTGWLRQLPDRGPAGRSVLAAFGHGRAGGPDDHAEQLLSLGLFTRDRLDLPVGILSAGQRQRLALARLVSEPYDVLLLDEPSNHLSPALVEELEAALAGFPGAVVVVSHDRMLRSRWQGRLLNLQPATRHTPAPAA